MPGSPTERFTTQGFQLWTSADGRDWTQVGKDGFGRSTSYMGDVSVHGGKLYLQAVTDYRDGSQLWQSEDGQEWKMIFHEPPDFFHIGPGLHRLPKATYST